MRAKQNPRRGQPDAGYTKALTELYGDHSSTPADDHYNAALRIARAIPKVRDRKRRARMIRAWFAEMREMLTEGQA